MVHQFLRTSLLAAAACCCLAPATAQFSLADNGAAACGYGNGYGYGYGSGYGRGQGFPIHGADPGYCMTRGYGRPDLFYNFYVPGRCGGYPAEMYPAPKPTPPIVGHVYYTYQPLMPHEMMYRHRRNYFNLYDGGRGLNHTTVTWW